MRFASSSTREVELQKMIDWQVGLGGKRPGVVSKVRTKEMLVAPLLHSFTDLIYLQL